MESILCIIKPDAMRLGYKQNICHMIHMFGFNVVAEGTFKFTRVRAEQFYRAHAKMPYFEDLIRFMISRSIHCMVLMKDNCCRTFRALLGPKDSNSARKEAPQSFLYHKFTEHNQCEASQNDDASISCLMVLCHSEKVEDVAVLLCNYKLPDLSSLQPCRIRALYGTDGRMNAVHGTENLKDAELEIKFFFPTVILEPYPTSEDAAAYFKENLQPILLKGMTALAKTKPASDTIGAVKWLANWLHDHNPRLPLVCICVEKKCCASKEEPVIEFPCS